jgi:two-component system sensor histidine kinase DegS
MKKKIAPIISTLTQSGIEVKYAISEDNESMNYASLIALYRFAQECSTNIIKHSKASQVSLDLYYTKDEAIMEIKDNGIGFDFDKISKANTKNGMGLYGLIERFELIRGKIEIESSIKNGVKIIAYAPKDPVQLIGENNGTS